MRMALFSGSLRASCTAAPMVLALRSISSCSRPTIVRWRLIALVMPVHDHEGELLRFDQFEFDSNVDGLGQRLLHAFFAQQLAKLD